MQDSTTVYSLLTNSLVDTQTTILQFFVSSIQRTILEVHVNIFSFSYKHKWNLDALPIRICMHSSTEKWKCSLNYTPTRIGDHSCKQNYRVVPQRKRGTRGFSDCISLKLQNIDIVHVVNFIVIERREYRL